MHHMWSSGVHVQFKASARDALSSGSEGMRCICTQCIRSAHGCLTEHQGYASHPCVPDRAGTHSVAASSRSERGGEKPFDDAAVGVGELGGGGGAKSALGALGDVEMRSSDGAG